MLGENNAKEALPAVLKLLKNKDKGVKYAAINTAASLGGEQVLDDFYKVMRKGDSTDVAVVSSAILGMKGNGVAAKVASLIPDAKPNIQVALLAILSARAANAQLGTIYARY